MGCCPALQVVPLDHVLVSRRHVRWGLGGLLKMRGGSLAWSWKLLSHLSSGSVGLWVPCTSVCSIIMHPHGQGPHHCWNAKASRRCIRKIS